MIDKARHVQGLFLFGSLDPMWQSGKRSSADRIHHQCHCMVFPTLMTRLLPRHRCIEIPQGLHLRHTHSPLPFAVDVFEIAAGLTWVAVRCKCSDHKLPGLWMRTSSRYHRWGKTHSADVEAHVRTILVELVASSTGSELDALVIAGTVFVDGVRVEAVLAKRGYLGHLDRLGS